MQGCLGAWVLGVEGAADGDATLVEHVGVDHGGFDVFVAEQLLHGADVPSAWLRVNSAVFEQVGGEAVPEDVRGDALFDVGLFGRVAHRPLDGRFSQVVPLFHA